MTKTPRFRVALANTSDRQRIHALRHEIYARELHQHPENTEKEIRDQLDEHNLYIVAKADGEVAGFVSITPPREGGLYSLDKYLGRDEIPFKLDAGTFEVRILTVVPRHRGSLVPLLLMYAAFRWVEAHGGTRIVSVGRREVRKLYTRIGLRAHGREFKSGDVDFVFMSAEVDSLRERLAGFPTLLARLEEGADWSLIVPFHKPAECFHGGAFFSAIGDEFDHLHRVPSVINADVLDAWFPPSPRVLAAVADALSWLMRTSPPTGCEGLTRTIARTRGIPSRCILPGAGSSALIFLALREWLSPSSRAVLLDPTYGEYAHVLEKVIRCRVDRLELSRAHDYDVDLDELRATVRTAPDVVVIVNPNSPTGRHIKREDLEAFLREVPAGTLVWIDETYVEYVGREQSLEEFAVSRPNVIVCKSLSKVYALSGLRCAYLCASPHLLEHLRSLTPPWAVSLPAQVAAVQALQDSRYYAERHRETRVLRGRLAGGLTAMQFDVVPGSANFLLCHLPESAPTAAELTRLCADRSLFVRDVSNMGASLGQSAIRIAVKDSVTTDRMLEILQEIPVARCQHPIVALDGGPATRRLTPNGGGEGIRAAASHPRQSTPEARGPRPHR